MIRRLLFFTSCLCLLGILSAHAQAPVADFSASVTSGCGPLSVQFKDLSTNAPLFWNWDFGNSQTSTLQNPTVSYSSPGTYAVTLIVRNRSGSDAMRKTGYITVFPYPTPLFASNHTLACAPANIQFSDQSTPGQGSITSWAWDLGDGATSNLPNPSHTYSQTGYFNINLKVTNSGGCSNTAVFTRYLRVVDGIQPNFTWDQTSTGCTAPFTIKFLNQTAGPGDLTFNWNLGNGAIPAVSSDTSPANITYPSSTNYTVTLQVQSSLGCSGSVQQVLPLSNNNIVLTGPDVACVNSPATFTNSSTPLPTSTTWDFGDGTTSSDPSTAKTYAAIGAYTVKLVNRYASCADSTTKIVQVTTPPVPNFVADVTSACKGPLTVHFTDNTLLNPTQWLWDFGDGTTSAEQNPTHTYNNTGNFDVKLTVTTAGGCSNTLTKPAFITIQAPTMSLTNINTLGACTTSTPVFNTVSPNLSVNAADGVQGYFWEANGAVPSTSNLAHPTFTYATPGVYSLKVTVSTNGGCSVSNTFANVVKIGTPTTPVITPSADPVCGNKPVTFTDPATPVSEYQWLWDFGDGPDTTTTLGSVEHTFSMTGINTVTLTLIHNGCPQTATRDITVSPPIPGFFYKPDCPVNIYQVMFYDSSKTMPLTNPISYTWDFGDGTIVANVPPGNQVHMYPIPSPAVSTTYNVTLTIDEGACLGNTFSMPVTVGPIPFDFTPPAFACRATNFELTATSPHPELIASYSWHFDTDPPGPFTESPTFTANNTVKGPHRLTLTILGVNGCTDSKTHDILITSPTAQFDLPVPAGGCKNATISFIDHSTPDPATGSAVTSWIWDFDDHTKMTTLVPAVIHQFTDTGLFTPQLIITDNNGCKDTYTAPGPIHITSPVANFGGPDSFYCPKVPLTFRDSSIGFNLTYAWDFGDGNTGNTPIHSYTDNNTYNVTLTVTDQFSCTSSITKPVRIQSPISAFDIADTTAICFPLQTQFTAHGQFYDSLYWSFGDGSTSTLPTTSHFYNTLDIFVAKLFVRGPGGCLDSASRRVLVLNPNNTTIFTYGPLLRKCDSVPVDFAITPPAYTSFTVNFGDGNEDSSKNTSPFHMYRNPATYTPLITLLDATGCIVTLNGQSGTITVLGTVPFFSVDPHTFCDSSTVTFEDFTYVPNDGITSQTVDFGDNSPPFTVNPPHSSFEHFYDKPGVWVPTMKVVTNSSCTETYTDTIRVYQTPHPVITMTSLPCTGLVQFQGSLNQPQVDTISWTWNFSNDQSSTQQNPAVNFLPGNYTATLHAAVSFGCNDQTSDSLTIFPLPQIKGPHEITTPVGIPVTIPFTYSDNINTFSWTPTTNLDCSTCSNPTATIVFSNQYEVTVTDANGCVASDTILIKTICNDKNYFLPNTFSPNGDGVNDYFYPRGSNLYNIQSLRIFNRWGQMIFERRNFPANAATMGWDGSFNGRPAASDAYVYIAEVICDNGQVVALHGDVTLVR